MAQGEVCSCRAAGVLLEEMESKEWNSRESYFHTGDFNHSAKPLENQTEKLR